MTAGIADLVDTAGPALQDVIEALPWAVVVWPPDRRQPVANRRFMARYCTEQQAPSLRHRYDMPPWGPDGPEDDAHRLGDGTQVAIHRAVTPEGSTVVTLFEGAEPIPPERVEAGGAHLATILENISDGVFLIDANRRVIEFNRRALSIYRMDHSRVWRGMPYDTFLGLCGDLDALTPERREEELAHRRSFVFDPWRRFTIRQLFTGETLELTKEMTRDGAFVFTVRDITETLRQARALEEERRRDRDANAHKSRFMARMSHEMRTPLNGVLGIAALLERTELDAQQAALLDAIRDSGAVLLRLIDDLLDSTRLDTMDFDLVERPFLVCDVVREATQIILPEVRKRGLTIEKAPAQISLPSVVGDAVRLKQVLLNLLNNAVKFTDSGRITVGLEATLIGETARLGLYVEDTGIGIAPQDFERIFEQFEQLERDGARPSVGVGLGLSISRRIIGAMGGTLTVSSTPSLGSRFTIDLTLPLTSEEVP
ncbi:MAG: ATP-binding protein [Pseudomonadota bacterium]